MERKAKKHNNGIKERAIVILALALIFIVVVPLYQSYSISHPIRRLPVATPSDYGMAYESVSFSSPDGLLLKGWFIPGNGSRSLVIACHGHGSSKGEIVEVAGMLHRNGYSVLLFDFRAHGESEGHTATLGRLEVGDLMAAVGYSKERADPDSIGVIGFSLGGATAIMAAGQNGDINAVVSDSAFADRSRLIAKAMGVFPPPIFQLTLVFSGLWGMSMEDNPSDYAEDVSPNALMIIQGDRDHLVDVEDAELLYGRAKEPKELWIVPDAPHVVAYGGTAGYEERVIAFFNKHL